MLSDSYMILIFLAYMFDELIGGLSYERRQ